MSSDHRDSGSSCNIDPDQSHHRKYNNRGYHASGRGRINVNNQTTNYNYASLSTPLEKLEAHCSPGAAFDSAARLDPPRCAESTQRRIIQTIEGWINSETVSSSLFWLYGDADVGKSALAQSLSEKFHENRQLAASFFFCRNDASRNNGDHLIPTLVSHLVDCVEEMVPLIEDTIRRNRALFTKKYQVQIRELLVQPLLTLKSMGAQVTDPLLIVIDGLDECENQGAQCELLRVIARAIPDIPYPLRFLITSRPEAHITNVFDSDPELQVISPHRYNLSHRAPTAPQLVQATSKPHDPCRQRFRQIAEGTIDALQKGYYDGPVARNGNMVSYRYHISRELRGAEPHTTFYPHDSIGLHRWQISPQRQPSQPVKLSLLQMSILEGARYMDNLTPWPSSKPLTGILNFASGTRPGSNFLTGATGQEESIARSSSLYLSLVTPTANRFYASHMRDDRGGFYTHAMIYSPDVLLIRSDDGAWLNPIKVEVVSSPPVDTKEVRRRTENQTRSGEFSNLYHLAAQIREVMKERMGRILALFELRGVRNLVLGSFGTGVAQNDVRLVAGIWSELLNGRQTRFSTSFDNVLFVIPDKKTLDEFKDNFGPPL